MRVLAETGLRRRELAGLDLDDVEIGEFPAVAAKAIEDWVAVRPKTRDKALFTNLIPGRTGKISTTAVYDLVVALGKRAGIRKVRGKNKVHPHALRHTVFTEAAREVNRAVHGVETIIKFTRHKDPRVAQTYIDATDDAASNPHRRSRCRLPRTLRKKELSRALPCPMRRPLCRVRGRRGHGS